MSGCRPMIPVRLSSPLGGEFVWTPQEGEQVCDIRGIPLFVEGASPPERAQAIVRALRVFPDPFLRQFFSGRTFVILPKGEFERVSAPASKGYAVGMGIKTAGSLWYIRDDLLAPEREGNFTQRLWYAVAARVADLLEGEEGFDRHRFQASFNRYLTKRLGNPLVMPWLPVEFFLPGVDPMYQMYLDRLAESRDFDQKTLRELFQEAREDFMRPHPSFRQRLLLGQEQPWAVYQLYQQFMDKGYTWRLQGADTVSLGLQSAASRERPESSHRLNLHYMNAWVNSHLGNVVQRFFPKLSPQVLWAPGIVGSYETRTAGGDRRAALLAGSLLDVGVKTLWGDFALHSYVGLPLTVQVTGHDDEKSGGERPFSPEWEVGVNYRGLDGALFVGSMCSVSFFDPNRSFLGFVLRWEE